MNRFLLTLTLFISTLVQAQDIKLNGVISAEYNQIKNLADPTETYDAVTKFYVDNNTFSGNYYDLINKPTVFNGSFIGDFAGNLFGNVTGDVIGNLTGNVTGDLAGDVAGNLFGNVTGDLTGDVTGNLTGNVIGDLTGDVTGNVTGDVTGNLTGNVIGDLTGDVTGDLTGNVTGDVTGDVTGNLTGNVIGAITFSDGTTQTTAASGTSVTFDIKSGIIEKSTGGTILTIGNFSFAYTPSLGTITVSRADGSPGANNYYISGMKVEGNNSPDYFYRTNLTVGTPGYAQGNPVPVFEISQAETIAGEYSGDFKLNAGAYKYFEFFISQMGYGGFNGITNETYSVKGNVDGYGQVSMQCIFQNM